MLELRPNSAGCAQWQVLEVPTSDGGYRIRITHVFGASVYAMKLGGVNEARYAKRPYRIRKIELQKMEAMPGARWGSTVPPAELLVEPVPESDDERQLNRAYQIIEPLLSLFEKEENLKASRFSFLIRTQAEAVQVSFDTVKRLLMRYYYFGATKYALIQFARGPKPGENSYRREVAEDEGTIRPVQKRRGRKSRLSKHLGENKFVVGEEDIQDMLSCMRRRLRHGRTGYKAACEDYLATEFARRHPVEYQRLTDRLIEDPVKTRQFRYYIERHGRFEQELADNLISRASASGHIGSLRASCPGDIYEVDPTGGRLFLLSSRPPHKIISTPTIYLVIDRWSRYVTSVYMSLRPPSYEELRYALMIAFTSRTQRFSALGCNVDDDRWPVGVIPQRMVTDGGPEFISVAVERALTKDLRIQLTKVRPLCPDAKAIVERFIRTMKQRMYESMQGAYERRQLDPKTEREANKAQQAAIFTLAEGYRELIKIIVAYNNTEHSHLRQYNELTQAGIKPTPQEAYLWGLKTKSTRGAFPYTEDELKRIFYSHATGNGATGMMKFEGRIYHPKDDQSEAIANTFPKTWKAMPIRLDRSYPHEIHFTTKRGEWATFTMNAGGMEMLGTTTLDEEEALADQNAALWEQASYESRVDRVQEVHHRKKAGQKRNTGMKEVMYAETADLKAVLDGKGESPRRVVDSEKAQAVPEWRRRQLEEEAQHAALVARRRAKS